MYAALFNDPQIPLEEIFVEFKGFNADSNFGGFFHEGLEQAYAQVVGFLSVCHAYSKSSAAA